MRQDAARRRLKIIETACRLWRTEPPEEVTLARIARAAGVGIATVYRNFADRRELDEAAAVHLLEVVNGLLAEALENFSADPRGSWDGFVHALVDKGVGTLVPALAPEHLSELPQPVQAARARNTGLLRRLLAAAHGAGLISSEVTTTQFVARLTVVSCPPVPGLAEIDPQVTADLVELLLEHGRLTAAADSSPDPDAATAGRPTGQPARSVRVTAAR